MNDTHCFHCGEPNPPGAAWCVEHDGAQRTVCCAGCEAVASTILQAGLNEYYRHRTAHARPILSTRDEAELEQHFAAYTLPEIAQQYLQPDDADRTGDAVPVRSTLLLEGMHCGACVWLLEQGIGALPGVDSVTVNLSTARADVHFDSRHQDLEHILRHITRLGYGATPHDPRKRLDSRQREQRRLHQQIFLAGLGAVQAMMFALPEYISTEGDIEGRYQRLLHFGGLVITIPVLLFSARSFFRGAWNDIRRRRPGMDTPIALVLIIAFVGSVVALIRGSGETWFDSICMFVFLLLGARYLEWRARQHAAAEADAIGEAAPLTAWRIVQPDVTSIDASALQGHSPSDPSDSEPGLQHVAASALLPGDQIRIRQGETVPVDSRVIGGQAEIDQSILSGESLPISVACGDRLPAGAVLLGAWLDLEVESAQADSTLARIGDWVHVGSTGKPGTIRIVDRLASVFVTVVLLAAAAAAWFWWHQDPAYAWRAAIAVLIVSCPCALSLATPTALAASTSRLMHDRLLITHSHALETLARVDHIVFDKTGTLSTAELSLHSMQHLESISPTDVLALAQRLERGSDHPLAQAIARSTLDNARLHPHDGDSPLNSADIEALANELEGSAEQHGGAGVSLKLEDRRELRLGSARWCAVSKPEQTRWRETGSAIAGSEVYLSLLDGASASVLARFEFLDRLREDTARTLAHLAAAGYTLHLVSGDRPEAVDVVASELAFQPDRVRAAAQPEQKQQYVRTLQQQGHTVLMVGDGLNDAPVLASSDVSLAFGKANSLTREAADVLCLNAELDSVRHLIDQAVKTRRIIRQNLLWALSYNLLALPAAALLWIPPWLAAIGMSGSSLLVVGNALRLNPPRGRGGLTRLRRIREKHPHKRISPAEL